MFERLSKNLHDHDEDVEPFSGSSESIEAPYEDDSADFEAASVSQTFEQFESVHESFDGSFGSSCFDHSCIDDNPFGEDPFN